MKKVILLACLCCTLFSCEDVEKKAGVKITESTRRALCITIRKKQEKDQ